MNKYEFEIVFAPLKFKLSNTLKHLIPGLVTISNAYLVI